MGVDEEQRDDREDIAEAPDQSANHRVFGEIKHGRARKEVLLELAVWEGGKAHSVSRKSRKHLPI
jgi:hypothetical protein